MDGVRAVDWSELQDLCAGFPAWIRPGPGRAVKLDRAVRRQPVARRAILDSSRLQVEQGFLAGAQCVAVNKGLVSFKPRDVSARFSNVTWVRGNPISCNKRCEVAQGNTT